MLVSLNGITLWQPLVEAFKLLGDISVGLMIFALGVRLATAKANAVGIGVAGAIVTPITGMLAAWAFGELAGLPASSRTSSSSSARSLPPFPASFLPNSSNRSRTRLPRSSSSATPRRCFHPWRWRYGLKRSRCHLPATLLS